MVKVRKIVFLTLIFSVVFVEPSQADVIPPEQLFGKDAETFISDFEAGVSPKLNEYMGLLVAAAGFGLVLKSVF